MHMRPLIEEGLVYKVVTPYYGFPVGKKMHFLYSEDELNEYIKRTGETKTPQVFKGLGSLSVEESDECILNAETRKLVKIEIGDIELAIERFNTLMGKDLIGRREMVMEDDEYGID